MAVSYGILKILHNINENLIYYISKINKIAMHGVKIILEI
jgi:hypothetical protein